MNTSRKPLSEDLPAEIREYLATVPPVTRRDLESLRKAGEELDHDPAFQADYLKSLFVARMLEALAERNETQSELARRWNRSRQYVSKLFNESKKVNFTIETMCEVAHLLGRRICIEVLRDGEESHVVRCIPAQRVIEPLNVHWREMPTRRQLLNDQRFPIRSIATSTRITNFEYDEPCLAA